MQPADRASKNPPMPRRTEVASKLTHETIEAHLTAFKKAGGSVEVLGDTPASAKRAPTRKPYGYINMK